MNWLCSICMFLGRIFISAIFIISGLVKVFNFNHTVEYMKGEGIDPSYITALLVAAILLELVAGVGILIGLKIRLWAFLLFVYLIPVTLIFHHFWTYTDNAVYQLQLFNFLKNLGIMGGLLYILGWGAGKFSCDHSRHALCTPTQPVDIHK